MSLCRYFPTPSDRMGILWSLLCIEDSVVLEYGPAGTTHYSISLFGGLGVDQQNRLFTTHMSEDDGALSGPAPSTRESESSPDTVSTRAISRVRPPAHALTSQRPVSALAARMRATKPTSARSLG